MTVVTAGSLLQGGNHREPQNNRARHFCFASHGAGFVRRVDDQELARQMDHFRVICGILVLVLLAQSKGAKTVLSEEQSFRQRLVGEIEG